MNSKLFLAIIFSLLAYQVHMTTQDISTNFNKTLGLSFIAQKNQTGHYITKWLVHKLVPELPKNMKIEVQSSNTVYGGSQMFQLKATIIVPPSRPADYELFPGIGYYKFYPKGAANFQEASATCINDGAHLAILNSEAEFNVLKTIYARHADAKEFAYIGFHDMDTEGKYVTIFGDPLETTGFTRWKQGEPSNNEGNEDCGSIHKTLGLNDQHCEKYSPWPFFCEYDLSWSEI